MYYHKQTICPHCGTKNFAEFEFYSPEDGDYENDDVTCQCGCEYSVTCTVEVEVEFYTDEPVIISLPEKEGEERPYHSTDPNQLNFWEPYG